MRPATEVVPTCDLRVGDLLELHGTVVRLDREVYRGPSSRPEAGGTVAFDASVIEVGPHADDLMVRWAEAVRARRTREGLPAPEGGLPLWRVQGDDWATWRRRV